MRGLPREQRPDRYKPSRSTRHSPPAFVNVSDNRADFFLSCLQVSTPKGSFERAAPNRSSRTGGTCQDRRRVRYRVRGSAAQPVEIGDKTRKVAQGPAKWNRARQRTTGKGRR